MNNELTDLLETTEFFLRSARPRCAEDVTALQSAQEAFITVKHGKGSGQELSNHLRAAAIRTETRLPSLTACLHLLASEVRKSPATEHRT